MKREKLILEPPEPKKKRGDVHGGRKRQAWETPWQHVHAVAKDTFRVAAFDLDVCATAKNAKAKAFIALPKNGLCDRWAAVNWCNPPYENQDEWIDRAHWWARQIGAHTALLVLASTSALYWRPKVLEMAAVDYYEGRIPFVDEATGLPVNSNSYASALVLVGPSFEPGRTRYRNADTGKLVSQLPHRALELPFTEER